MPRILLTFEMHNRASWPYKEFSWWASKRHVLLFYFHNSGNWPRLKMPEDCGWRASQCFHGSVNHWTFVASGPSVSLHPYSVPLLSPCYYWRTMPCPQLPFLWIFCQLYTKVWRLSFGTTGRIAYWILIHSVSGIICYIYSANMMIFGAVNCFVSSLSLMSPFSP
jgi:hypothetical protein